MHAFHVSKEIQHPADQVWKLLDNFADTWVYHPIVQHSTSLNGKQSGLGAKRQCQMYSGDSVQEEVVEHNAALRTYKVVVTDHGPFPMTHMEVTIRVEAVTPNRSRVTYEGGFTPKFGPAGWVMGVLMMKPQFTRMMGQLIDGVDAHLTTGRTVGEGGRLQAAA